MTQLSDSELAAVCRDAGFGRPHLHTAIAAALATSNGLASYNHPIFPGPVADYRGLWGVDLCEHPDLIGVDLANPYRAAEAAHDLTAEHSGFGWCPAYRSGAFYPFLDRAGTATTMVAQPPPAPSPIHLYAHRRTLAEHLDAYGTLHDAVRRHPANGA